MYMRTRTITIIARDPTKFAIARHLIAIGSILIAVNQSPLVNNHNSKEYLHCCIPSAVMHVHTLAISLFHDILHAMMIEAMLVLILYFCPCPGDIDYYIGTFHGYVLPFLKKGQAFCYTNSMMHGCINYRH